GRESPDCSASAYRVVRSGPTGTMARWRCRTRSRSEMTKLRLTLACGDYDRTRALANGSVAVEGVELNYITLGPEETFWRMEHHEEFDVSEMSFGAYTVHRGHGESRFIAIPVFPSRAFRHNAIYVHASAGIERPEDLKGRRVGVP